MKKTLMFSCLLLLCDLTTLAQIPSPQDGNVTKDSATHRAAQERTSGSQVLYTNLGSPTDAYSSRAWLLTGLGSGLGVFEYIGIPFAPKANSHVVEVRVAAQYSGSGANQVNLSIYSDAQGSPGTLLAGPTTVTNLPNAGTCCTLAIADFVPVSVTAGTVYWVVADTPTSGVGSDFLGQWNWVSKVSVNWSQNVLDSGWNDIPSDALPAGEVLGTVP